MFNAANRIGWAENMVGGFISEDIEMGRILHPITLNHYYYCWGNPVTRVDLNGRTPIFSQKDDNETIWNYYIGKVEDAWESTVDAPALFELSVLLIAVPSF